MTQSLKSPLLILLLPAILFSCGSYKQDIMFQVNETTQIQKQVDAAEKNYVIQKNDYLSVKVFTNEGERLIDPDFKLMRDNTGAGGAAASLTTQGQTNYLIDVNGKAKLPMVGEIMLEGLTLRQAEELLQKEYQKFYQKPFVVLRYENKRVVVLGAPGGVLVPLENDNVTLVEVLAIAKGIPREAKAHNIRVLRGKDVFIADLSTFDGYTKNNLIMIPGDVVYIEPVRRPVLEGLRDYGPFLTILTSVTTLLVVVIGI